MYRELINKLMAQRVQKEIKKYAKTNAATMAPHTSYTYNNNDDDNNNNYNNNNNNNNNNKNNNNNNNSTFDIALR